MLVATQTKSNQKHKNLFQWELEWEHARIKIHEDPYQTITQTQQNKANLII